jgi:FkbM family methyltransferase
MEMTHDPGQQLYPGLFGEVTVEDVYGMRDYAAEHDAPDVVFDIGANVGIFTRFAREVFPDALIVAVEPDAVNFGRLCDFTPEKARIVFDNRAIGSGDIWRVADAINGAHECYLSENPGHGEAFFHKAPRIVKTDVESVSLADLVEGHVEEGQRYMVKMDCEGGENSVFAHKPSMLALEGACYLAIEVHTCAAHGGEPITAVRQLLKDTWKRLCETHDMVQEHTIWTGARK